MKRSRYCQWYHIQKKFRRIQLHKTTVVQGSGLCMKIYHLSLNILCSCYHFKKSWLGHVIYVWKIMEVHWFVYEQENIINIWSKTRIQVFINFRMQQTNFTNQKLGLPVSVHFAMYWYCLSWYTSYVLQDNYEFLSRCIKENLGFKNGKPIAARIIYKCLLQWHAFESERTAIFDYIIEGINDVLKVNDMLSVLNLYFFIIVVACIIFII